MRVSALPLPSQRAAETFPVSALSIFSLVPDGYRVRLEMVLNADTREI